jgi:hypothetical protein
MFFLERSDQEYTTVQDKGDESENMKEEIERKGEEIEKEMRVWKKEGRKEI